MSGINIDSMTHKDHSVLMRQILSVKDRLKSTHVELVLLIITNDKCGQQMYENRTIKFKRCEIVDDKFDQNDICGGTITQKLLNTITNNNEQFIYREERMVMITCTPIKYYEFDAIVIDYKYIDAFTDI